MSRRNVGNKQRSKWQNDIKIIVESLLEGRKSESELARKLGKLEDDAKIPGDIRKRVYRNCKRLKNWGLVKRDEEGRWCWYSQVRIFGSEVEYRIALDHSKQLLGTLERLTETSPSRKSMVSNLPAYTTKHLITGYPDAYKMLRELRSKEEKIQTKKRGLNGKLLESLREKFGELIDRAAGPRKEKYIGDNVPEVVYTHLHTRYRGYPSPTLWIDPNNQICYGTLIIGRGKGILEDLKAFIETESKKEHNITTVKQIISLEEEKRAISSKLAAKIREIADMVRHGTPLEGECQTCPHIKMKK